MKLEEIITARSNNICELCGSVNEVQLYEVQPQDGRDENNCLMACAKCRAQIDKREDLDPAHWSSLSTTMWSEVPAIQVVSWRMLNRLRQESWAADLLDMLYLDEDKLQWAKASGDHVNDATVELHKDAYGMVLQQGDTVVLTKNLDVKGLQLTQGWAPSSKISGLLLTIQNRSKVKLKVSRS